MFGDVEAGLENKKTCGLMTDDVGGKRRKAGNLDFENQKMAKRINVTNQNGKE